MPAAVENDVLPDLVADRDGIEAPAIGGEEVEVLRLEHRRGRIEGIVEENRARARAEGLRESLLGEPEMRRGERDEARGAIKSTIAWLQSRRNAPDFTTMGMVEERLLKALEAAK